jgi:iron complex transport system substrate-binding protein
MRAVAHIGPGLKAAVAIAVVAALYVGCKKEEPQKPEEPVKCGRLVSLAPSITETLFALGLGDRVVGVTRYCDYPKEALSKTKVGGYTNPNFETIVKLKPDLVLVTEYHGVILGELSGLKLKALTLKTESIEDVVGAIREIGETCGVEKTSEELAGSIEGRLAAVRAKTKGLDRPRVLLSVGRSMGTNSLKEVFIAGKGTFFDEAVEAAGGTNAYTGETVKYPRVSAEGILELNPDVIVDLVADIGDKGLDEEEIKTEWRDMNQVSAVKNGRVHVLGEDYVVVPGPRVVLLVERLARLFHPEVDWN